MRRYGWLAVLGLLIAVWLLNVSRVGTRVEGCPRGCATAGPRRDGPLRIMSLNVLHGFPRFERLDERLGLISAEIRRQDADIVCLQEVPWRLGSAARSLARRVGMNYLYVRANGNRWTLLFEEGEAILSRYPLQDATFVELEPRAGIFEQRVALRAVVLTPWDSVAILSTHLTHGRPETNRAQAASLAAYAGASKVRPAIVAGDFNATEDSAQIRALGWTDTYRAAHPGDAGFTCCVDDLEQGPGQPLHRRIDYIFLLVGDSDARVVASQRVLDGPFQTAEGWLWASDHAGLLSTISLGE